MPATRNPPGILTDIHAQHVTRMPAQRARQSPVIGAKDVDVFVETAADEERARFLWPRFEPTGRMRFGIGFLNRWSAVPVRG